MIPFISVKRYKIISEKIRLLGEHVKRIHINRYIILDKATKQMLGIKYVGRKREQKIVKIVVILIKNVMNLKWVDFDEIISLPIEKSEKTLIYYISLPNEILKRIF